MISRAEIEQAVANLSPEDFTEFEYWFNEERNRRWDLITDADAEAGTPDVLLEEPAAAEKPTESGLL